MRHTLRWTVPLALGLFLLATSASAECAWVLWVLDERLGDDPKDGNWGAQTMRWIVLGAEVAPGDPILFCRRDPESARADLDRMLRQLAGRLQGPPKAGIYVSCIARGAALFGEPGVETGMIRDRFGDIPLIGFFANGEISRDRLYGHTGVLTLFT